MTLARAYLAASTRRWHTNPALAGSGQSVADHHGRCVQLLLLLHPAPSLALIRHLATHDLGESVTGDMPGPCKARHPDVAARLAVIETAAREALCGADIWLTEIEWTWAHLIDRLEAHCWCLTLAPGEHARAGSGWPESEAHLRAKAEGLGCGPEVAALLDGLKGGRW